MSIHSGWLMPHPPLIFPEVGRGKQNEIGATVAAFKAAAVLIAETAPETIVIISPHSVVYSDYFHISSGEGAEGDMRAFGAPGVCVRAEYDEEFVGALSRLCEDEGFPAGTLGEDEGGRERPAALDHGVAIPVRFINEAYKGAGGAVSGASGAAEPPRYVRVGVSGLSVEDHYVFGGLIASVAERLGRKTVVIASGDLSHKLVDDGPYGYAPEGPEFDRVVCEVAEDGDFSRLFDMDAGFLEKAAECGHRPLLVMAGALDRKAVESELYSYEGPFGVGYGIASFVVCGEDGGRTFLDDFLRAELERASERMASESPHVELARRTVESYVRTGRVYESPESLAEELTAGRAGVFVTIKKQGALRGCIGTITPVTENVGEEIRANAVSAAARDPRFPAIDEEELPYLEYSVDVLAPAEPIMGADELDPFRYGVIVNLGRKRGLLLPNLEGIEDAETQVGIAMKKAGIAERDRSLVDLERFEVVRHR